VDEAAIYAALQVRARCIAGSLSHHSLLKPNIGFDLVSSNCSDVQTILDVANHPVVVHCNKVCLSKELYSAAVCCGMRCHLRSKQRSRHAPQGKHRTGCLIGCLRGVSGWTFSAIFEEYRCHAGAPPPIPCRPFVTIYRCTSGSKFRRSDQQFIELFVRKYPKILVRGVYLPLHPSAACIPCPSDAPTATPPSDCQLKSALEGCERQLATN
jgi:hypothetical protein